MGRILYVNDQMQKTYDESDKNTKHENGLKSSHIKKGSINRPAHYPLQTTTHVCMH